MSTRILFCALSLTLVCVAVGCSDAPREDAAAAYGLYTDQALLGGQSMQISAERVREGAASELAGRSLGEVVGRYDQLVPWRSRADGSLHPRWASWSAPEYIPDASERSEDAPDGGDTMIEEGMTVAGARYRVFAVTVTLGGERREHRSLEVIDADGAVIALWDPVLLALGGVFELEAIRLEAARAAELVAEPSISGDIGSSRAAVAEGCVHNWEDLEDHGLSDWRGGVNEIRRGHGRTDFGLRCHGRWSLGATGSCRLPTGSESDSCIMDTCLPLAVQSTPCVAGRGHGHFVVCAEAATASKGPTTCNWQARGFLGVGVNSSVSVSVSYAGAGGGFSFTSSGTLYENEVEHNDSYTCAGESDDAGVPADGGVSEDGGRYCEPGSSSDECSSEDRSLDEGSAH